MPTLAEMDSVSATIIIFGLTLLACVAVAAVRLRHAWTVRTGQVGVLFKDGMIVGVLKPGRHVRWGLRYDSAMVDTRESTVVVAGQEILTGDGLPIRMSLTLDYCVVDPVKHLTVHSAPLNQAYSLVQAAMRDIVASLEADDLVQNRSNLASRVLEACVQPFADYGYELKRVQVRDITFPGEIKTIMTAVVRAKKEGLAALERARGESAALRNLANSARMLQENPGLLQLRMLQALAETKGATLVFNGTTSNLAPLPAENA